MRFETFELSLQLIASLRAPLEHLRARDASLVEQIRRAATSVSLNLSEGRKRVGKDRLHLWRIAGGSAEEVRAALLVAEAWKGLDSAAIVEPLVLLNRILGAIWKMTH